MLDRGRPLSLWGSWWIAIQLLRPAFSRLIPIPDLLESNGVLALDSSDTGLGTGFLI